MIITNRLVCVPDDVLHVSEVGRPVNKYFLTKDVALFLIEPIVSGSLLKQDQKNMINNRLTQSF